MAIRDQNFALRRDTQLRSIDIGLDRDNAAYGVGGKIYNLQRGALNRKQSEGLRDISQARTQALQGVVANALSRGVFNSGIYGENRKEVLRETTEARSDLRYEISNALGQLKAGREGEYNDVRASRREAANQENYWRNLKLEPLQGGGGNAGNALATALENFIKALLGPGQIQGSQGVGLPDVPGRWGGVG